MNELVARWWMNDKNGFLPLYYRGWMLTHSCSSSFSSCIPFLFDSHPFTHDLLFLISVFYSLFAQHFIFLSSFLLFLSINLKLVLSCHTHIFFSYSPHSSFCHLFIFCFHVLFVGLKTLLSNMSLPFSELFLMCHLNSDLFYCLFSLLLSLFPNILWLSVVHILSFSLSEHFFIFLLIMDCNLLHF